MKKLFYEGTSPRAFPSSGIAVQSLFFGSESYFQIIMETDPSSQAQSHLVLSYCYVVILWCWADAILLYRLKLSHICEELKEFY
jgi:hypothetical protein